jgi:tRNA (guanine37-N1)-methyltransferase
MWNATVLTLFPDIFKNVFDNAIAGKAKEKKIWDLKTINIRDFSESKHKKVDDTVFGGGAGMLMTPEVVHKSLEFAVSSYEKKPPICYLTPRGMPLKQKKIKNWVKNFPQGIILLCGRYEGIDQRVIEYWQENHNLEEVSIGDFVLSGGEIAAINLIDACVRILPNVLENEEAKDIESFELDLLEYNQYTKPRVWKDKIVPDVLLSGDHKKIAAWRKLEAENITKEKRPDLWEKYMSESKN